MGNQSQDTLNMTDTESDTDDLLALHNGSNRESTPDLVRLDTDNLSDIIVSGIKAINDHSRRERIVL